MQDASIEFELGPSPDVDETPPAGTPGQIVQALSERKARRVVESLPGRTVLTADTLVFLDDEILGKPRDAAHAVRMLRALSGRDHQVLTGLSLAQAAAGALRCLTRHQAAVVHFRALSEAEIEAYVATGEPLDKAGAYGIQGGAAAFATCSPADWDCVVGLPVALLRSMLAAWGPTG